MEPNIQEQFVATSGQLTIAGYKLLAEMTDRIVAIEAANVTMQSEIDANTAKFAAIAAITGPTGGVTVDSEARTAINAIIAAS